MTAHTTVDIPAVADLARRLQALAKQFDGARLRVDELGDRDDLAAQELRRFAAALRPRMDEVRSGR